MRKGLPRWQSKEVRRIRQGRCPQATAPLASLCCAAVGDAFGHGERDLAELCGAC